LQCPKQTKDLLVNIGHMAILSQKELAELHMQMRGQKKECSAILDKFVDMSNFITMIQCEKSDTIKLQYTMD